MSHRQTVDIARRHFITSFLSLGYSPKGYSSPLREKPYVQIPFIFGGINSDVNHEAWLEYKPRMGAYSLRLGLYSENAVAEIVRKEISIQQYLTFGKNREEPKRLQILRSIFFDAGRILGWPLLLIPEPNRPETLSMQFEELQSLLRTAFWDSINEQGVLNLLSRNEKGFDWCFGDPVYRISMIAVLSNRIGRTADDTKSLMLGQRLPASYRVAGCSSLEELIERVIEIFF